ncbi:MAG: hypothetical protein RMK45_10210 [Armatimonadota bacterium]|nr:hypothetical protein [Armatimonadota bacterium]
MRRVRGSAFTEILVSVFIVTLLVLSITALSPMTARMQRQAQQYTRATTMAQLILEHIRMMDFSRVTAENLLTEPTFIAAGFQVFLIDANRVEILPISAEFHGYSAIVEIVNLTTNNNISIGLKTITVTVQWHEAGTGRQRTVRMATTIASLR